MWLVLAAALVTVKGRLTSDGALPGATVTLTCGAVTRTAVTDVEGRYAFQGVAEGERCNARYELEGFEKVEQSITAQKDTVETALELIPEGDTITVSCSPACSDDPPETPYDAPLCTDALPTSEWIMAAANGDKSAVALLRARYAETQSLREKHRIAGALFGRMPDEDLWNDLATEANLCVRWPQAGGDLPAPFLQWCRERGLPPEDVWWSSYSAFVTISEDHRSRWLLHAVIESDDPDLADAAMWGLVSQRDETALPAIERALKKFPGRAMWMEDIDWPALAALVEKRKETP